MSWSTAQSYFVFPRLGILNLFRGWGFFNFVHILHVNKAIELTEYFDSTLPFAYQFVIQVIRNVKTKLQLSCYPIIGPSNPELKSGTKLGRRPEWRMEILYFLSKEMKII